jgi:hypothetical protein
MGGQGRKGTIPSPMRKPIGGWSLLGRIVMGILTARGEIGGAHACTTLDPESRLRSFYSIRSFRLTHRQISKRWVSSLPFSDFRDMRDLAHFLVLSYLFIILCFRFSTLQTKVAITERDVKYLYKKAVSDRGNVTKVLCIPSPKNFPRDYPSPSLLARPCLGCRTPFTVTHNIKLEA